MKKFNCIDLRKEYLEQERWDILSKVLTILIRGKGLRGLNLAKAVVKVQRKPFRQNRLEIYICEEGDDG